MSKLLWWKESGDEMASAIAAAVHDVLQRDTTRIEQLKAWEAIYEDCPADNYGPLEFHRDRRSRLPVLAGMVDASLSRIGRAKPLPSVLTSDGEWSLKRKARLKSRWLAGMFKKLDAHEKMKGLLHDALVLGTGVGKVYYDDEGEGICFERVWAGDLHVEELEAKHGCVRTLYQTAAVDRDVLCDRYPDHKEEIARAESYDHKGRDIGQTDLVLVVEAWRIGTKTTPGKHAIAIDGCTLREEKWEKTSFPFVFVRWHSRGRKFWGKGMVEGGAGLQSLINATSETIEDCFRLSFPCILAESSSGFQVESVDNTPWQIYTYKGTPPQFVTPPPFGDGYVQYLNSLKTWLFETQGVSELAAASHKPAGLNSGKALLVFQDVESERFLIQGREFENGHVLLAELIIDIAEDIYKTTPQAEALRALGGRKALEAIEYKDVRFADQPWSIQVYPVTSLSHSPSGRLEQIQELIAVGAITDPATVRELLDYPDLERYTSIESAQRDLAEKLIDHALDKGEAKPANPYMDLPYTLKRSVLELNLAEMENAPERSKEALREFIGQVEMLIEAEQAQAEEAAAAEGMAAEQPLPEEMGPEMMGPEMMDPSMMDAGML